MGEIPHSTALRNGEQTVKSHSIYNWIFFSVQAYNVDLMD